MSSTVLVYFIVFCEVAFWLFLGSGLIFRYVFKWNRLSAIVLFSIPLIDLVLLTATIFDLRAGSTATFAHGLAAAYLGFTVAFGKTTIEWADRAFARRFADGPADPKPPGHGIALLKVELKWFARCLLAVSITILLSYLAILLVNDHSRTEAFEQWITIALSTAFMWFIFGPLWSAVFYWRPRKNQVAE